jgi:HEAT repeat protein
MFDRTDWQTRLAICGTVANFHSATEIVVPVLLRGLTDTNDSVRISAASGLGQLGHLETVSDQTFDALTSALDDHNAIVRLMSVQSLGMIGFRGSNVLSAIQRACLDRDPSVRNNATNALQRLGR